MINNAINMRKIFNYIMTLALAVFALASCETYKVDDPEMSAIDWFDGEYVCFVSSSSSYTDTLSVYDLVVTNTSKDEADRAWVTISDLNYTNNANAIYAAAIEAGYPESTATTYANGYYDTFLDALIFDVKCDVCTRSFSISGASATEPALCHNPIVEQGYNSATGNFGIAHKYTVTVKDGTVGDNDVTTATGYKTNSISFSYTKTDSSNKTSTYYVHGIKNTGWGKDVADYAGWVSRQ